MIKDLPTSLLAVLDADHALDDKIPVFKKVRFTKQTPRKRRLVNEAVAKRYHADLKNADLLSNAKLRSLNIERGEWSVEEETRLRTLAEQSQAKMRDLYFDGMDAKEKWSEELLDLSAAFRRVITDRPEEAVVTEEQKERATGIFTRWLQYTPESLAMYTLKYAEEQGKTEYSPD